MRIIFLEAVHNFGGASKSTLELAKRLISNGYDVLIVDFWGCCQPFVDKCQIDDIPLKIIDKRDSPILLKDKNKINSLFNYIGYLRTINVYKKIMGQIIDEFKPEIISVNNTKTLSILSSSKFFKIAYFARGWFLPNTLNLVTRRLLKNRVDIFLTVSQATRQMVYAGGFADLSDIFVVCDAVNLQHIYHNQESSNKQTSWDTSNGRSFTIMHCGTFIHTKGQHITIEVLKTLVENNVDTKLLLVGLVSSSSKSINYLNYLKSLVEDYRLENHVEFIINKSDILEHYARTDLLIHPSYTEGLPRVVLEAMGFGIPVVGNAVGGMIDIILNNFTGYLTNFNNIQEYVDIIQELISDKNKYKIISKNSKKLIKSSYLEGNQIKSFEKIAHLVKSSIT